MKNRLVTPAKFAKICGITRQSASTFISKNKQAVIKEGKVDLNAKVVIDYLVSKNVDLTSSEVTDMTDKFVSHDKPLSEQPLQNLIKAFGGIDQAQKMLDAEKKQQDTNAQRIKNDVANGSLIDIDFAHTKFVAPIIGTLKKILSDVPQSVAPDLVARCEVGGDDVEVSVRKMIHDSISSILKSDIQKFEKELNAKK